MIQVRLGRKRGGCCCGDDPRGAGGLGPCFSGPRAAFGAD
jgi:hypothetical protein